MKIRIKIQGALALVALLAAVFFPKVLFARRLSLFLEVFLEVIGIAIVFFGFLFRVSARGYKEEKTFNGHALVKSGPYKITRNPMYFGTFMIGIGTITALFQPWVFFVFVFAFLLIYATQTGIEERVLSERFGQDYRDYCKITPKYFPSMRNILKIRSYLFLKPFWIKKELPSIMATGAGAIILFIAKFYLTN